MGVRILALPRKIILILGGLLRFGRDRHIAFCLRIGNLHVAGQKVLGKQPGRQHLLRIFLIKNTNRGSLRNHLHIFRVILRNGTHRHFKGLLCLVADIRQRRIGAHPGRACGGIHGEYALTGI